MARMARDPGVQPPSGHNIVPDNDLLRGFFERIPRLQAEQKGIVEDIKNVKAEAKASGFDVKMLNAALKIAAMKPDTYRENSQTVSAYLAALGID